MADQFFGLDRLNQQYIVRKHLNAVVQGMLDMWWSGNGDRDEKPVITGITVHYDVQPNRRRARRARKI